MAGLPDLDEVDPAAGMIDHLLVSFGDPTT